MADAGLASKLGATPGKLVVVALLATGLVAVVLFQVGGSSAPADTRAEPSGVRATRPPAEPDSPAAPTASPAPSEAPSAPLPRITFEEASAYDPFAPAPALAELVAARAAELNRLEADGNQPDGRSRRIDQTVAALRDTGVHMVLLGQDEELAIVGDRTVRVGDVMGELEVIAIHPEGITLSDQGAP